MLEYDAGMCGWTLARAHARAGDPVAIDAYLGGGADFDTAITDFSQRYADQNEQDSQVFVDAVHATGGSTPKESETTTLTAVQNHASGGGDRASAFHPGGRASRGYMPSTASHDYCRVAGRVRASDESWRRRRLMVGRRMSEITPAVR